MALLDTIQETFQRLVPRQTPAKMSGGMGGHGVVPFDDDVSFPLSTAYMRLRIGASALFYYDLGRLTVVFHSNQLT